jgi:uncharacterized protein YigA (DUF484 family)
VDYSKLPFLTIQAIKELKAENDGMQSRIADLQKELRAAIEATDALRARLATLERLVPQKNADRN